MSNHNTIDIVSQALKLSKPSGHPSGLDYRSRLAQWGVDCVEVAYQLSLDNPGMDVQEFLACCGVED